MVEQPDPRDRGFPTLVLVPFTLPDGGIGHEHRWRWPDAPAPAAATPEAVEAAPGD